MGEFQHVSAINIFSIQYKQYPNTSSLPAFIKIIKPNRSLTFVGEVLTFGELVFHSCFIVLCPGFVQKWVSGTCRQWSDCTNWTPGQQTRGQSGEVKVEKNNCCVTFWKMVKWCKMPMELAAFVFLNDSFKLRGWLVRTAVEFSQFGPYHSVQDPIGIQWTWDILV